MTKSKTKFLHLKLKTSKKIYEPGLPILLCFLLFSSITYIAINSINLILYSLLGNKNIHSITKQGTYELRVDISDFNGNKAYARYSTFAVGDASTNYKLTVGGYSGHAGELFITK